MITQEDAEKALEYIVDNAPELAKAKATKEYLEQYRKSQKAILFNGAPKGRLDDQLNFAYAHPDYTEFLEKLRIAIEEYEKLSWYMKAAGIKVDAWRTQESSRRVSGP